MSLDTTAFILAAAIYGCVLALTLHRLLRRRSPYSVLNFSLILTGALIQTVGLWIRGVHAGSCPVSNPFEILQFISWSTILLFLFTGPVFRMSCFGTTAASLAALLSLTALAIPSLDYTTESRPFGPNPWIESHAAIALLAYGAFALLCVVALLYLLQHFSLKAKRFPAFFGFLPPIMDMEIVLTRLLISAVAVFTIAMAIGMVAWLPDRTTITSFKSIASGLLWLLYCTALILRLTGFLHGTRLPWTAIFLFAVALLTLWPVESSVASPNPTPALLLHHAPR